MVINEREVALVVSAKEGNKNALKKLCTPYYGKLSCFCVVYYDIITPQDRTILVTVTVMCCCTITAKVGKPFSQRLQTRINRHCNDD